MDQIQNLNGFQFDQNNILDQQVGGVCPDDSAVVMDGDIMLLFDIETSLAKFECQSIS